MSELEAKKADLRVTAENRALEKIASEEQRLGRDLSAAEREKYKNEALVGLKQLQDAAEEEYVSSRRFDTGWSQAFRDYASNATNAAQQAQRIFQSATQGMEDMLMGFFKTGKFGWKDFVQNIIDVMMRSQIQQLIAKTFGGIGSVGGAGGGGKGLFGGAIIPGFLAEGGPASANKPYIVGERGPELFVPNTTGTVVPNNALGGGNVTYNINAVDAMSFKQMLAQDPTFLHAVAEQGRRRLPGAR
jgi:lambda family phage tail tape measure protein